MVKGAKHHPKNYEKEGFVMQLFRGCREDGCKDNTILWFIILFVLLFFCGGCGDTRNTNNCCD